MIIPIIMSGGSGSRLWPLSRKMFPKQFLPLASDTSMLQETLARLDGLPDLLPPILVCNEFHRFIAAEQIRQLGIDSFHLLLEPAGRNTAPAVALAALQALELHEDPVLLVLAADHVIQQTEVFQKTVLTGLSQAQAGQLMTFGIEPTHAETGYGYIKRAEALDEGVFKVAQFVEKPDAETAAGYLASGDYDWNSGMFMFRASRYLEELERFRPDILAACRAAYAKRTEDLDFLRVDKEAFLACPEDSIDYAVMEQTEHAVVVPMQAGWDDVGSWSALWDIGAKDAQNNVTQGDVLTHNVRNSYLHSEDRLLAAVGVEDLVVVTTPDAVLVLHKDQAQDVKKIVQMLEQQGRSESDFHRVVYRPWGSYDSIDMGERFQVKRICVKPGAKLSLQMHHHRAEHWIVVSGTALVTVGGKEVMLSENQSTYIPIGVTHRLENPGRIPLELIEVQSGSYLGEDDIVRFEDSYGRTQ